MALITKSQSGTKRALFYDETKTRRTVYLGKVSDKESDTIRRTIESILSSKIFGSPIAQDDAAWLAKSPLLKEKLVAVGLIQSESVEEKLVVPTLKEFLKGFIERQGNRSLQFSVLLLLAVTLICTISIRNWRLRHNQIDPRWRDEVFYDCEEIEHKPSFTIDALYRTGAKLTLSNTGHTTLYYSVYGLNHIRAFQEFYIEGEWKKHDWEWCGTGASEP